MQISSPRLLLLLLSLLLASAVAASTHESSKTLKLPDFRFTLLVNDEQNDLNLFDLKTKLNHVTENHLAEFLKQKLSDEGGGHHPDYYEGMHLSSTVKQLNDLYSNQHTDKSLVSSDFVGQAIFSSRDESMNPAILHILVAQAFLGEHYWKLIHRFVEEGDVLAKVDSLDITIDTEGMDLEANAFTGDEKKRNRGTIAVLAIFSIILFGSTAFLLLLAYRRYRASGEDRRNCCNDLMGLSKNSDSTDEDEEDHHDDFQDEVEHPPSPPSVLSSSFRKASSSRRKQRRVRPAVALANLDSIQEDEEEEQDEEMAEIPLDSILI